MIGKIATYSGASASGSIKSESGENVAFDLNAVLAYDTAGVAVGREVNFEIAGGIAGKAVNIQIIRRIHSSEARNEEARQLRYMGFESRGNVRTYKFERLSPGQEKETFAVEIDMVLFKKHHVVIQDGPALCLWLLSGDAEPGVPEPPRHPHSVTDGCIAAWVANKPIAAKSGRRSLRHSTATAAQPA
jgi:hypothetical protein